MENIPISKTLYDTIDEFIQDNCVKRELGYESVQDYIIQSIEGNLYADKDIVLMI